MAAGEELFAFSAAPVVVALLLCMVHQLPATEGAWTFRMDCGSLVSRTDTRGNLWVSDRYSVGTSNIATRRNDQRTFIYNTERYGRNFGYVIPVPSPGYYNLNLYFAELVFTERGERVFDVFIKNPLSPALRAVDVFRAAKGANKGTFLYIPVYTISKKIYIGFTASQNAAQVCGLYIEQSRRQLAIPPPTKSFPPASPPPRKNDSSLGPPPPELPRNYLSGRDFRRERGCSISRDGLNLLLSRKCGNGSHVVSKECFGQGTFVASLKIPTQTTTGILSSFYLSEEVNGRELRFDYRYGGDYAALEVSIVLAGVKVDSEVVDVDMLEGFNEHRIVWLEDTVEFWINFRRIVRFAIEEVPMAPVRINFEIAAVDYLGPVNRTLGTFRFRAKEVYTVS